MSDMPERIWAIPDGYWSNTTWGEVGNTEYIRADAVDDLIRDAVKRQVEAYGLTQRSPKRYTADDAPTVEWPEPEGDF